MEALLEVILPVFLVLGIGYLFRAFGRISDEGVEGLMRFAQNIALPMLLFRAIGTLDLAQSFDVPLLAAFYAGALAGFAAGLIGARVLFGRPWEDSIAIGFIGLFSNSLLLGLPITERAYGTEALQGNYAIVALHAPICYTLGVTAMESVKSRGGAVLAIGFRVLKGMLRNPLVIGILGGFALNVSGVPIPKVVDDGLAMLTRSAVPVALFALGGVLWRYRPEGDMRTILYVCAVSLLLHPAITFGLGRLFGLDVNGLRSAVVTASMAPGVNTYLFANMYGVAKRVSASAVLIGTALSLLTVWFWLGILP